MAYVVGQERKIFTNEFCVTIILVATLTLLGELGNPHLLHQRDEFLALINFEPSIYVLFLLSALSIATRSFERSADWYINYLIMPFSGAFVGWGLGLTLTVLVHGHYSAVAFGLFLTLLLGAVTLAPVVVVRMAISDFKSTTGRLFSNSSDVLLGRLIVFVLATCGSFGLLKFYFV
jgi:hypothetical protein